MPQNIETDLTSGELLDRALSNIRHLLGNSVSTLKITLEVLLDNYSDFDEDKKVEFIRRAANQVDMQQHLLVSMKKYSRSVVNRVQPMDFNSFWDGWVQEKREALAQKGIQVRVKDPEISDYKVMGEPKVLNLVLNEVIVNAIDALTDVDDPKIDLIALASDSMRVVVRDNGKGIKQEELKKIFIPFYSKDNDSSGMGLPVIRKLLISMGGSISLDSSPDLGTSVFIKLKQTQQNKESK
jgi:signal transduction histidine kinase